MGFVTQLPSAGTPPQVTKAQAQAAALRDLTTFAAQGLNFLINNVYKASLTVIGKNKDGLTPQEVFDVLGTKGAVFLQSAQNLITYINNELPNTLPETLPIPVTVNEDGTVTIAQTPPTT